MTNHPDFQVIQSYNNLAVLYESQGRYSEAEPLFQKALKIAELSLGVNHHKPDIGNLSVLHDEVQNRGFNCIQN